MLFAIRHNLLLLNPGFNKDGYAKYFDFTYKNTLCRVPEKISRLPLVISQLLGKILFHIIRTMCKYPIVPRIFYSSDTYYYRSGLIPKKFMIYLSLGRYDDFFLNEENKKLMEFLSSSFCIFFGGWKFRTKGITGEPADIVRTMFKPRSNYAKNISDLLVRARGGIDVLVGLHIRHEDYKTFMNGEFFYELNSYTERMSQILQLFEGKSVRFLICNNAGFSKDDFAGFNVIIGSGEQLEDMYTLAGCDYIIGPPSTFTAWASFWGRAPLQHIYPAKQLTLEAFKIFEMDDFVMLDSVLSRPN